MTSQKFSQRHNTDGSFDSICMTCSETVSSKQYIWELGNDEQGHQCNPLVVAAVEPGAQPQLD